MAEAALDLRALSRTFEKSNQDFRKAANDNSNNLSRIVKDIAKTFAQQRRDIASIEDAITESVSEQQATSAKVDRLANIFGESISLQSQMVVQLKNIASGMNAVNDNVVQMSNAIGNPSNPIQGSLLGTLSGMAIGGTAGAVAGAGAGAIMSRQEISEKGGTGYEDSGLNQKQVADMIRKSAISRGIDPETAVAVAKSEGLSTYRATGSGAKWGMAREPAYGPFQLLVGAGTSGPQGLGDRFKAATGIDPATDRSAASIQKQIDYALDEVKRKGWGQWYGAARSGINNWQGVNIDTSKMTPPEIKTEATKQESAPTTPAPAAPAQTTPTAAAAPTTDQQQTQGAQNPTALSEVMHHGHGPISSSLEVKGGMHGQAFSGGEVHPGVMTLASKIQESISGFNRFTAFNDAYHHRVNPGSKHAQGLAADFTIKDPSRSEEAANQIRQMLQSMGVSGRVINEYTNPSAHATGGHLHVQFDSAQEAEKFKSGKVTEPSKEQKPTDTAGKPETKNMVEAPVPPSRPAEYSTTQPATPETATPAAVPTAMPTGMGMDPSAMMGMLGGLGGMGNIGGMLGTAMPMLGGILNALGSSQNMPQMFASTQPTIKSINEAAVQSQAAMEQNFAGEGLPDIPAILDQGIQNMGRQMFASYNNDQDLGWPSWAANIGGWNWGQESKKVKYNMNQIG